MTKRIIDADALDKLLEWINGELNYNDNKLKCETCNNQRRIGIKDALDSVLEKINELTTPAHEPQENINTTPEHFETIGQCIDWILEVENDKSIKRSVTVYPSGAGAAEFNRSDFEVNPYFTKKIVTTRRTEILPIATPTAWRPMPNIPKEA